MNTQEHKYVRPSEIKPYYNNPRQNDDAVIKIAESISAFGFQQPILVDEHQTILAGHTRWKAALKLKMSQIPVVISPGLTDEQKAAYRIADNKLSEVATWQYEKLIAEFETIPDDLLQYTGFSTEEIDSIITQCQEPFDGLTDEDEIPEPGETRCKTGDLWRLGDHRLLCGDATKAEDVARLLDGVKVDLLFTDPPYGINVVKKNGKIGGSHLAASRNFRPIIGDDKLYNPQPLIGKAPVCFIWGANHFADKLPNSRGWVVWDKRDGMKGNLSLHSDIEMAWTNLNKSARIVRHTWCGMIRASERGGEKVHPAQKPVMMILDCFDLLPPFNIVYDPYMGSGSTLMAAQKVNRQCYGMEIDSYYCDVILTRWENFTGQEAERIS